MTCTMDALDDPAHPRRRPVPVNPFALRGAIRAVVVVLCALAWTAPALHGQAERLVVRAAVAGAADVLAERPAPQDPASPAERNPVTEADERAAGAQDRPSTGPVVPHPEAREAIGRLKSPFCPGLMLEVCPSPQAQAVRDTLRVMAEEGADADSLVAWFLASYGEEWRGVPETRGRGLLAWVVPPAMLVLGAVLVVVALRRLRGEDDEAVPAEAGSLTADDERRIDEALRELERGS